MHKDVQRGLYGLAMATGIFILGTSEASAAETTGSDSITGGTQLTPVITAPMGVEDNAITLIGNPATGSTDNGTTTGTAPRTTGTAPVTNGEDSIAGGTQITPVITAPMGVEDNAITLIGNPATGSTDNGTTTPLTGTTGTTPATSGEGSIGGGTQITPLITTPIAVEDNAITVIGNPTTGSQDTNTGTPSTDTTGTAPATNGEDSIAGGTQITPLITTPIAVEDNAITVIGDPTTGSQDTNTGTPSTDTTGTAPATNGEDSIAGGTQITPLITTPIAVEDNAITVIGDPTTGSKDTHGTTGTAPVTDGENSTAGGTQITPVITTPVAVKDNAITVIGNPTTSSQDSGTTTPMTGTTGTAPLTGGEGSIGGGTQITPVITAPIAVENNAITVIGDSTTGSKDTGTTNPAPGNEGENSSGGGTQSTPVITTPIAVQDNAITVIGNSVTGSQDTGSTSGTTTPGTDDTGTDGNGTPIPGTTTPVSGGGAGAGAEHTTGVDTFEVASAGGSVTAGGAVDTHATEGLGSTAAAGGVSAAGHGSFEHRAGPASSTVVAAGNTGFGIDAAGKAQHGATAHHGRMLAHTDAASMLIAGMATALVVTGVVLLLTGRRRAALAQR
ncbi:beta strand repeat-containing protein [Kocuria arenosa]|uniref:beta strand repeat-containing protein n=1 Tax=Kocuria arenosa TaxID=3071446 RepID=UPI0034D59A91